MMEVIIRKALKKDLKSVMELNTALFQLEIKLGNEVDINWTYSKDGRKYFLERLSQEKAIFLVAEINKKIVGYVIAFIEKYLHKKPKTIVEIENMYVLPKFQRKGVGQRLVTIVEDEAKRKGALTIFVVAISKNNSAKNFYRKMNFKETQIYFEKAL